MRYFSHKIPLLRKLILILGHAFLFVQCGVVFADSNAPPLLKAPFDESAAKKAQDEFASALKSENARENSLAMKFSLIPPGEFMMGSPETEKGFWNEHKTDELLHQVKITKPFYLGKYPVRVRDFRSFVEAEHYKTSAEKDGNVFGIENGRFFKDPKFNWQNPSFDQGGDCPVVNVSWDDAIAFCSWLSEKEGKRYRLPTEAEWEYACRAGTTTPFNFGKSCDGTEANCNGTIPYGTDTKGPYLARTTKVGSYKPNAFGLFDMHGNVCEWCSDWYAPDHHRLSPLDNPLGAPQGTRRVSRGGTWYAGPILARSANRGSAEPDSASFDCGFRVVMEP